VNFWFSYAVLAEIYVMLALSTNLLVGIVGIFSVSQAAVFGVGAYILAAFTMSETLTFLPALLIAMACCIALNILLALPSLRVAGDYFVVTSFGIQLLATAVFSNWTDGTGGANGLPGIPPPEILGLTVADNGQFLVLATLMLSLLCACFWLLMRAPFGRLLRAIREDELAVAAAGKSVLRAKVAAAAVAGAFAGAAGGLYCSFLSFVDPSSFDLDSSVLILTMMVLGGARTLAGSIVGPFVLLALPQLLTLIEIPTTIAAAMRQLLYGLLLIAFMLFRPQGLLGERL
jgi:branched-chain amino acid transport system permease protein